MDCLFSLVHSHAYHAPGASLRAPLRPTTHLVGPGESQKEVGLVPRCPHPSLGSQGRCPSPLGYASLHRLPSWGFMRVTRRSCPTHPPIGIAMPLGTRQHQVHSSRTGLLIAREFVGRHRHAGCDGHQNRCMRFHGYQHVPWMQMCLWPLIIFCGVHCGIH